MRTIKAIIILVIVGACVAGGLYLADKFQLISLSFHKDLAIEKTANVVTEIKKIGEFTSACYYEEVAMHDVRIDTTSILGISKYNKNEILLIGKGRVRAGFDFAKICENDIIVHSDTLDIKLPQAEIFDIIINPSDFTVEYEEGKWDNENTKSIKAAAHDKIKQNAIDVGILAKAEESGKQHLVSLFTTFGFSVVNISVKTE